MFAAMTYNRLTIIHLPSTGNKATYHNDILELHVLL